MPEGDSIRRVAANLRPLLLGKALAEVRTGGVRHDGLAGQTVVAIEPVGKHLLITIFPTAARGEDGHWYGVGDAGVVIRSHLGMNGRWMRYPAAAPPGNLASASLALATADDWMVCTKAMQVEILQRRDPRLGAAIGRLGPDILGDTFEPAAVVARARRLPADTPAASMLLDQSVAAGIGNIFTCEALFAERIAPGTTVGALTDDQVAALYADARSRMQASVRGGRVPGAVYRRAGLPCTRCGATIRSEVQGGEARRRYWCPGCQV